MNNKPFVSIIIPFYNTPLKAFKRCINSVLAQSNGDFEAIIVNDGSKKEYNHILKETVESDDRIRLINKNNEGSAIARNIGIGKARGEYIMLLDSDDAITDYCLEEAAEVVKAYQPDLVIGADRRVTEKEIDGLQPMRSFELSLLHIGPDDKRDLLISHMIGRPDKYFLLQTGYIGDAPHARLLRKSIAEKCLFSKEPFFSDDTIWNLNMLKQCKKIIIVDELWYKYLILPTSKIRRFRANCPYEFEFRTKQELELVKELWPNCMEAIYCRIFNDIVILARTFLFHPDNPKSWLERYKIYKECIHKEAFREALKGLNLMREKRIFNRIIKEILRFTACCGPHIVSYWILEMYYKLRKNKL